VALFANLNRNAVQDNTSVFDFSEDWSVDIVDIQTLFLES
jgi:hypothetical protein